MKCKIIRTVSQFIEKEVNDFLLSLPIPSQIIEISMGGEWQENHLAVVIIFYL